MNESETKGIKRPTDRLTHVSIHVSMSIHDSQQRNESVRVFKSVRKRRSRGLRQRIMSTDPTGSIRSRARARGVLVPVPTVVSCQGQGQGQGEGQGEGPREEGQSVGQRRGEQSFLERVLVGAITLGEVNVRGGGRGGGGIPYDDSLYSLYSLYSMLLL